MSAVRRPPLLSPAESARRMIDAIEHVDQARDALRAKGSGIHPEVSRALESVDELRRELVERLDRLRAELAGPQP